MNLTCIIFGIIFSAAGILFAAGRLHPYISAWKGMAPEEKEKINIIPLCRNIGEMILLSGILFLLNGFFAPFREHWFTGSMIAWMIVAGLDLCWISKSSKYRNL